VCKYGRHPICVGWD